MKFFLFSLIFHILIVFFALETTKNKLEFKQIGNPKVSFTITKDKKKNNAKTQNLILKKETQEIEKKEIQPKKKTPIKKQKKEIVKEKKKEKVIKKIKKIPEKEVSSKLDVIEKKYNKVSTELKKEIKVQEGKQIAEEKYQEKNLKTKFIELADGSIAAKNQGVKGLSYGFISQPEPKYPEIAKKMGFKKDMIVKVRFLIGYDGRIEEIKFYNNIEKFGFQNEVNIALKQWRTTPITVDGKRVKLYFYKKFKFEKIK